MKKVLSIFLFCGVSLPLFSSHSSQDRDCATEELLKFESLARETEKKRKKTERKWAHCCRSPHENEEYARILTKQKHEAAEDKYFRQGDFQAGHPLEVAYLQRVSRSPKKH